MKVSNKSDRKYLTGCFNTQLKRILHVLSLYIGLFFQMQMLTSN